MKNHLLATKLKELRKAHSYTQDYVAGALGVVRQTYANYETGLRTPNYETLFKLSGLYGVSLDDLMQISVELDQDEYFKSPEPTKSTDDVKEFLEFFNNPKNAKRFRNFSNLERELLYYFGKIDSPDQWALVEFAKILWHKKERH